MSNNLWMMIILTSFPQMSSPCMGLQGCRHLKLSTKSPLCNMMISVVSWSLTGGREAEAIYMKHACQLQLNIIPIIIWGKKKMPNIDRVLSFSFSYAFIFRSSICHLMLINYFLFIFNFTGQVMLDLQSQYQKFNKSRLKTALSSLEKSLANLVRKETFYQYLAGHIEHIMVVICLRNG